MIILVCHIQVNDAEIEQFSKEHGFAAWYRVSAKEGTQVKVMLIMMLTSLMALMMTMLL